MDRNLSDQGNKMFQVSTLQALMLGYTRSVLTAEELAGHGSIGLGTYENVHGEMIVLDGKVYRADQKGEVHPADPKEGVPFASVADIKVSKSFTIEDIDSLRQLWQVLNNAIEEDFGLNSMYMVRLDGVFDKVYARSEEGEHTQHVVLGDILKDNQKDFVFTDIKGSMVCLYYPDFMDGINAPGWHLHFISEDRTKGGHVFDLQFRKCTANRARMSDIEIQLPRDASFDTYALRSVSQEDIKKAEQG